MRPFVGWSLSTGEDAGAGRNSSPRRPGLPDPPADAVDLGAVHLELELVGAPSLADVLHEDEALEVQDEVVELPEALDGSAHAASSRTESSGSGTTSSCGAGGRTAVRPL